jgi:hypothetical protein
MVRIGKSGVPFAAVAITALAMGLFTMPFAQAQQSKDVPAAPLPSQVYSARKVFISNAGGDNNGLYTGGPERLYNQFYAAVKGWGRYELVTNPAAADLVLEVSFRNPFIGEGLTGGGGTQVTNYNYTDPQFRLVIVDPGTRVTLWTFTEHIERARLQGNRDKNFDFAFAKLANDLRNVSGQPAAADPKSQK